MSLDGLSTAGLEAPIESATRLLRENWPASILLTPDQIGLAGHRTAAAEFLAIVESLSDAGFLSYEALVVNAGGPLLIDAALTARGRAALSATASPR